MRVTFERQLNNVYNAGASFHSPRTETYDPALNRKARSKLIADMIRDAFENHDVRMAYAPCGSAHGQEIYDDLNKRSQSRFIYILKPP